MADDEQILIDPDGNVVPCCYLSTYFRQSKITPKNDPETWVFDDVEDQLYNRDKHNYWGPQEYLYKEYLKRIEHLNIFTNDLEDILNDEWFTKTLPESWEDPNKIASVCRSVCTSCDE